MSEPSQQRNVSPYTTREKVVRIAWAAVQRTAFRWSFHNMYRYRAWLLRLFGARVGSNVRVRRSVTFEIPWNVTLADGVTIGDAVRVYALGPITLGKGAFVSQNVHLCAGSHDYTTLDYPLLKPPIRIGEHCWVAADAFVGPGVTVGDGSIVAACAVVVKNVEPWTIVGGNPAKFIKPRVLQNG